MRKLLLPFMAGALAGGLFFAALMALDIGGLRSLIAHDRSAYMPVLVLGTALCALFGIVVAASSLCMAEPKRPDGIKTWRAPRRLQSPSR